MARSRDISKVLTSNTTLATDAELSAYLLQSSASTTYQTKATTGLTLISKTSFSGVLTHSVNNVFTSTYRNYKYIVDITATSAASTSLSMKLRESGTDTSTNYDNITINSAGTVYTFRNDTGTNHWPITFIYSGSPDKSFGSGEILKPNLASKTMWSVFGRYEATTLWSAVGIQTDSIQFDGLSLIAGTGTMGGSISIYGYNE
jgi:hypothetical protein